MAAELDVKIAAFTGNEVAARLSALTNFVAQRQPQPLSRHPAWLTILYEGLGHKPHLLEGRRDGQLCGFLPLAYVHSLLFGRFLVSLPYLNYGGVVSDDAEVAVALLTHAVELAHELGARHLELRHEAALDHPALTAQLTTKVHMRLPLPPTAAELWDMLDAKVRNQIRKGQKSDLTVAWGGLPELDDFYDVFSRNMRDLGTPVYGRLFFASILRQFPQHAELCIVRQGKTPIAAALLLHGWQVTEVPSASSLRAFNPTCANMLMYWHLLERAVQRGQQVFDFGRSTLGGSTYRFKKQWCATPHPAVWQYHVRQGTVGDLRPDNPRFTRLIRMWQRLPLGVTRWLGPRIVRGIP